MAEPQTVADIETRINILDALILDAMQNPYKLASLNTSCVRFDGQWYIKMLMEERDMWRARRDAVPADMGSDLEGTQS
jgi:hypothetical protein